MHIKVTFAGESAVDLGGPKREFFRLWAAQLCESSFFQGGEHKVFTSNVQGVQRGDYRTIGAYTAMSIVQGGPGFPEAVLNYFMQGTITGVKIEINSLPLHLKFLFEQLSEAKNDDEVKDIFENEENSSLLFETGYEKPPELDDVDAIKAALTDYHCMIKVKAAMDQFLDGLFMGGVDKSHLHILRPLLQCIPQRVDAELILSMLNICYSTEEHVKSLQTQAYILFVDFLDMCAARESRCSLQDVLVFYTGADTVPVLGYEKQPKLVFLESPVDKLPTASTCDLHLRIPTAHRDNFSAFKDWMELGILGHCGFGVV